MSKKSIIMTVLVLLFFSVGLAVAFDFGLRMGTDPNPRPIIPWNQDHSLGLIYGPVFIKNYPAHTFGQDIFNCFTNPVVEQPPTDDAWIFMPGATGYGDQTFRQPPKFFIQEPTNYFYYEQE